MTVFNWNGEFDACEDLCAGQQTTNYMTDIYNHPKAI